MAPLQNAAFCLSAIMTGLMFILWRRLRKEDNKQLWPLYGRFTGLIFCCSVFGICLTSLNFVIDPLRVSVYDRIERMAMYNTSAQDQWSGEEHDSFLNEYRLVNKLLASYAFYSLWSTIPEGVFLFCLNFVQMMVLERITRAAVSSVNGMPAQWLFAKRISIGVIVTFHLVSFCCRVTLVALLRQLAILYEEVVSLSFALSQNAEASGKATDEISAIYDR